MNGFFAWMTQNKAALEVLGTLGTILAGLTAFVGLFFIGWQAHTAARRHGEQTEADRERLFTDNFTKAVELLGDDKRQVRLGAIYILDRLSRESERDHWSIMEILASYLRERSTRGEKTPWWENEGRPRPPIDIQAVLGAFRNRRLEDLQRDRAGQRGFDLRAAILRWADLGGIDLRHADLTAANLRGADLRNARNLGQEQVNAALGDEETMLPDGLIRPTAWSTNVRASDQTDVVSES